MSRAAVLLSLLGSAACTTTPGPAPSEVPSSAGITDLEGAVHHPLDVAQGTAHVLIFIAPDCPISNVYAPEIRSLIADHRDDPLRFFLIHVDPQLDEDTAAAHARDFGYSGIPILLDREQHLVRATGVTITPEVAVLLEDGTLAYRGRIDDLYAELGRKRYRPTTRDLRDALDAVLAGRPVRNRRTEAVGCYITDY